MSEKRTLCMYCFEPIGTKTVCPHCGGDANAAVPAGHMEPGTMLAERFTVGRARGQDGTGIVYEVLDNNRNRVLRVREYFPRGLCEREPDGRVSVIPGSEFEFEDGMQQVREAAGEKHYFFKENGTAYVVQRQSKEQAAAGRIEDEDENAARHVPIIVIVSAAVVVIAIVAIILGFKSCSSPAVTDTRATATPIPMSTSLFNPVPEETPVPQVTTDPYGNPIYYYPDWQNEEGTAQDDDEWDIPVNPTDAPTAEPEWTDPPEETVESVETPVPTPRPTFTPHPENWAVTSKSDKDAIESLQWQLIELGWLNKDKPSGKYDTATKSAVKDFQKYVNEAYGAGLTEDGFAGKKTFAWLDQYDKSANPALKVTPTPEPTPEAISLFNQPKQAKVVPERLSVCRSPETGARVLGYYAGGTVLPVLGTSEHWAMVRNSGGITGYVPLNGIEFVDPAVTPTPEPTVQPLTTFDPAKNATVIVEKLAVYTNTDLAANVLGYYSEHAPLAVLGANDTWAKLQITDSLIGYVPVDGIAYELLPEQTAEPTEAPTPVPTEEPTPVPTEEPTPVPTEEPTPVPTEEPTPVPTEEPTPVPTEEPTPVPTERVIPELSNAEMYVSPVSGTVKGTSITLTTEPDAGSETVAYLRGGKEITVIGQTNEFAALLLDDGTVAFAPLTDIDFAEEPVLRNPDALKPTEKPTPIPTEEPTPVPTEEPTPEPTAVPTPKPTLQPLDEPRKASVIAEEMRLYTEPYSEETEALDAVFEAGTEVTVLESDGIWALIENDFGATCYVRVEDLEIEEPSVSAEEPFMEAPVFDAEPDSEEKPVQEEPKEEPVEEDDEQTEAPEIVKYETPLSAVTNSAATVYAKAYPMGDADEKYEIDADTEVLVSASDGVWCYVKYESGRKDGFILADCLTIGSKYTEEDEPIEELPAEEPETEFETEPEATPVPTTDDGKDHEFTEYKKARKVKLNADAEVFKEPYTDENGIALEKGMTVKELGTDGVWSLIENPSNGSKRYILSSYLTDGKTETPVEETPEEPDEEPIEEPIEEPVEEPAEETPVFTEYAAPRKVRLNHTAEVYKKPYSEGEGITLKKGMNVLEISTDGTWSLIENPENNSKRYILTEYLTDSVEDDKEEVFEETDETPLLEDLDEPIPVTILADNTDVYERPYDEDSRVLSMREGSEVLITAMNDTWAEIETADGEIYYIKLVDLNIEETGLNPYESLEDGEFEEEDIG